jgi:16S rRNA (guanine966-N2)-methyltransferase
MVENDRPTFAALGANRSALGATQVQLVRADALEFVRGDRGTYHVVFLDPPFAGDYWPRLIPLIPPRLTQDAWVYCEAGDRPQWPEGWDIHREGRAGHVIYQLLRRTPHEPHGGGLPRDIRSDDAGP